MTRNRILGMPVDAVTYREVIGRVQERVINRQLFWILAMNPEKIMKALSSPELRRLLLQADLFIPDGIGILVAGRIQGTPYPQRVAGADLLEELVREAAGSGWKIYLLGAAPSVAEETAQIWLEKYPSLQVAGVRNGYFSTDEEEQVAAGIEAAAPEMLFVAMGSPRQEQFIAKYGKRMNVPVVMGVGGSFDVVSGRVDRAPVWMQKLGLEWSWRLIKEPRRILRMAALPRFLILVLKQKLGFFAPEEEQK